MKLRAGRLSEIVVIIQFRMLFLYFVMYKDLDIKTHKTTNLLTEEENEPG